VKQQRNEYYRDFYDREASYWDSVYKEGEEALTIYAVHYRQRHRLVLDMIRALKLPSGSKSLDAGCGPGAYLNPLLEMGFEVAAIDQSAKMVETAEANCDPAALERVTLRVSGADAIPFPDASFDLVTNIAVLMYVPDDKQVVAELFRVLKPGGSLIITVDNRRDLADIVDLPGRMRRAIQRSRPLPSTPASSVRSAPEIKPRRYSPAEMRVLLTGAGFVVDEEASLGFAPVLVNGSRVFGDRTDLAIDRSLQFLRNVPGLRLTGYTYVCRCHRPEG
jgi:SAM-dependent methyltransferase